MDAMTAVAIVVSEVLLMPSKLFHAVVGVGISLGSAAACGGVADRDGPTPLAPDAQGPLPHPQADGGSDAALPTPDAAAPDSAVTIDAAPDATVTADASIEDAAPDAPKDAIIDAFCDAPWPITKSGREVCGPYEECGQTSAPWCFVQDSQGACSLQPLICVDQQWQCLGGATPTNSPAPPFPCQ